MPEDLSEVPLIVPKTILHNKKLDHWLSFPIERLHIVVSHDLVNNALMMARQKVGHAVTLGGIVEPLPEEMIFIPLKGAPGPNVSFIWKKHRELSKVYGSFLASLNF